METHTIKDFNFFTKSTEPVMFNYSHLEELDRYRQALDNLVIYSMDVNWPRKQSLLEESKRVTHFINQHRLWD